MRCVAGLLLALVLAGCSASSTPSVLSTPSTAPSPSSTPRALVTPGPTPSPTPKTCRVGAKLSPHAVVSVIGDSYTTGGEPDPWPVLLARKTGLRTVIDGAEGSGYMIGGYTGKDFTGPRFPDQVRKLAAQKPELVIIMGSRNDINHTDPPYPTVVASTLTGIRAAVPLTPVLVVGSFWVNAEAPESLRYIHDVLRAATAGIACASFVDPVKEGWFDHPDGFFGPDGEHPNAAGVARVAAFYVRDLRRLGYL